jgi:hypothetical protein
MHRPKVAGTPSMQGLAIPKFVRGLIGDEFSISKSRCHSGLYPRINQDEALYCVLRPPLGLTCPIGHRIQRLHS